MAKKQFNFKKEMKKIAIDVSRGACVKCGSTTPFTRCSDCI